MFFLFLIAAIGLGNISLRYRVVSNKRAFFRSALFASFCGSVVILLVAVIANNLFAPEKQPRDYRIAADSLTTDEADTSAINLAYRSARYHYDLLQKLSIYEKYQPYKKAVTGHYEHFTKGRSQHQKDLGHFGLGLLAMLNERHQEALNHFSLISDPTYPYRQFLEGDIFLEQGKVQEARKAFEAELVVENGNFAEACVKLIDLYQQKRDYASLRHLLDMAPAEKLFPDYLGRQTLLYTGDVGAYTVWLARSVNNRVNMLGLVAALAISVVWLIYLIHLDFFRRNRLTGLLVMFLSGFLCVFVVLFVVEVCFCCFRYARR